MTDRLYLSNPYKTSFPGRIVARLETADGPAIILEQTFFYPDSGGQPHDLGTIDGIEVTGVIEKDSPRGDVVHLLKRFPEQDDVSCQIESKRRLDHMQQHAGQHLLSAAFLREAGAQTLSFHMGKHRSTIDLDKGSLTPEILSSAQDQANRAVGAALEIRCYFVDAEEATRLELRKKAPQVEGALRIVEVDGFDRQACCGTHPKNTAEVGPIVIRGTERIKKMTRVEFLCGDRAIRDYKDSIARLRSLTQVLNSPENALVESATHLVEEKKTLTKSLQTMREDALQQRATRWVEEEEAKNGFKVVIRELADVTPGELRLLTIEITRKPSRIALLGARTDGRAHMVFGCAADSTETDMATLLQEALPSVDGRGGGARHMAQGGGTRLEGLTEALKMAGRSVLKSLRKRSS